MEFKTEIAKASCKGIKPIGIPNQDFILVRDNAKYMVATVSDGLGSAKHSRIGAETACEVVVLCIREAIKFKNIKALKTEIPDKWNKIISEKPGHQKDYRTANSFVLILKNEKKIVVGRLGDVLVTVSVDGKLCNMDIHEKDFINETDCLGSQNKEEYKVSAFNFEKNFDLLIASDGFADELVLDKMDALFDFLKVKYIQSPKKQRNQLLKKDITLNMSNKNSDDKSIVFICSNN